MPPSQPFCDMSLTLCCSVCASPSHLIHHAPAALQTRPSGSLSEGACRSYVNYLTICFARLEREESLHMGITAATLVSFLLNVYHISLQGGGLSKVCYQLDSHGEAIIPRRSVRHFKGPASYPNNTTSITLPRHSISLPSTHCTTSAFYSLSLLNYFRGRIRFVIIEVIEH